MVTDFEQATIDVILASNNAEAIVKKLLLQYAGQSVDNARRVLSYVADVSNAALCQVNKQSEEYKEAGFWLIQQSGIDMDSHGLFASMVPVCKAMFPNGYPDKGSGCDKAYFRKFVELLHDKRVFSWEKDKDWADMYGYSDYLRLVESQNCG